MDEPTCDTTHELHAPIFAVLPQSVCFLCVGELVMSLWCRDIRPVKCHQDRFDTFPAILFQLQERESLYKPSSSSESFIRSPIH